MLFRSVGYVCGWPAFSLIDGLPSSFSANGLLSLFELLIGTIPSCDSSGTSMRAVRPKPSPAVLRSGWTAGVSEVSRFSCMKFLGVSGVFDYAGLIRDSRYRSCSCCLPRITRTAASGLHLYELDTHPAYSLSTLRWVPHGSNARLEAERIASPYP